MRKLFRTLENMQKQIVLFVPENSPEVSEAIETLSKDRTVYLVYFVENNSWSKKRQDMFIARR